jgi:hypothetical protein
VFLNLKPFENVLTVGANSPKRHQQALADNRSPETKNIQTKNPNESRGAGKAGQSNFRLLSALSAEMNSEV